MQNESEINRIAVDRARDAIITKFGVVAPHNAESKKLYEEILESTKKELRQING